MKQDIIVPASGESVKEADIAKWTKSNGEFVKADEIVLELETDKASLEVAAQTSGTLTILAQEGSTVKVGEIIGYITQGAGEKNHAKGHPSPAAEKHMKEHGITPIQILASGKDGRITDQDVQKTIENLKKTDLVTPKPPMQEKPSLISQIEKRQTRREPMTRIRKTIAQRLVEAQSTAAMLTTFNEIDMKSVMEVRKKFKDPFKEKYKVGLGFMSFFTKAVCQALQEFPMINAQVNGDEIVYHDFCDIGIAVATPKGLVVPVIRNAEQLSFAQIESSIAGYAQKAKEGKLTLEDMEGGTFSITNGGTFGSMLSTPILNRPQSGILGLHNIVERPVAIQSEVKIRPIMYAALTYDHRIIDGADAVRFLVTVKNLIEDPARLLVGI